MGSSESRCSHRLAAGRARPCRGDALQSGPTDCPKLPELTWLRSIAVELTVLAAGFAGEAAHHPALAQCQPAAPMGQGRPPSAARRPARPRRPRPCSAPPDRRDDLVGGAQSEILQAFDARSAVRARRHIVVKCVLASGSWPPSGPGFRLDRAKWIAFCYVEKQGRGASRGRSGRAVRSTNLYAQHAPRSDQPFTAFFVAAMREWKRSFEGGATA